jgi:ABC-2 type transport system ATP-binding protein
MTAIHPVVLRGASVFYGEVIGLSRVDLTLEPGITGIIGPNGSGKTTLMRLLAGVMGPSEGSVRVLDGDPFLDERVRARTTLVPATEAFFENLTARENLDVAFLAKGYGRADARARTSRALEIVKLAHEAHRRYRTWSRGMRQRLKLGLTLASESDLVVLDEPFLGVDPPTRRNLRDLILELGAAGRTVLVSSHVLYEIESLTDRVGVLARGRLLGFGRVQMLLQELRDRHPHRVHVEVDDARALATALVAAPHIGEVKVADERTLEFVTHRPDETYRELPAMVVRLGVVVRRMTTPDDNLEAVFRHVTADGARRL